MSMVRFAPWVGAKYEAEGFNGLRVLIVGDSHYGNKHSERPTVTPEIVKALGQRKVHPDALQPLNKHGHFARIATTLHNASSASKLSARQRAEFWERVCYYNFVQEFLPKSREKPTDQAWDYAKAVFPTVLKVLRPDIVVAFGERMFDKLNRVSADTPVTKVRHPSAALEYAVWNPLVQAMCLEALERKERTGVPQSVLAEDTTFLEWLEASRSAEPAHGPHLTPDRMAAKHALWAEQMAALRAYPR